MSYIRITDNKEFTHHYEIRAAYPDINFSEVITDDILEGIGIYNPEKVEELTEEEINELVYSILPAQPEYDPVWHTCLWENNAWIVKLSEATIQRDDSWTRIRNIRNNLLDYTDTLVTSYSDEGTDIPQQLKDDRQALRNFPQTYMTGEIDDWVQALATIKNFPIFGTTSAETEQ
jgi:hypothetical protein